MNLPEGVILGIESSNPSSWTGRGFGPGVAVSLVAGGRIERIDAERIAVDDSRRNDLMTAVERLTARAKLRPRDVRGVAVSAGPGGFTALRIAVTAAKMIAEATGAMAFAVPSACVAASRFGGSGRFAVALASKGETAWVTVFDGPDSPAGEGRLADASAVASLGVRTLVADRFLPETMVRACGERGIEVVEPEFDPFSVVEAAAGLDAVDPVALAPIYPREPEAVTKWRALKGRGGAGPG